MRPARAAFVPRFPGLLAGTAGFAPARFAGPTAVTQMLQRSLVFQRCPRSPDPA